ncbi:hypothetical protein LOK49_LG01G02208 [Camellia lanceoleosa]|uniref:Uncharacterized protein n=1 Tax=Camellia lanceoleosa TaxID=1840588 RepID=A0ACC0IWX3_9ERIC|nr:hypothetical protein LOK49_LG01G02208 [Camellia lanceoleosa]
MVSRCDVYKAASEKKPVSLQIFCNFYRENEGSTPIDERGNTVLHILSVHGKTVAIRELDKQALLSTEHLKKCNVNGQIALHEAARFGHKEIAEIMLKKEGDGGDLNLILARNELGETPIHLPAPFGKKDVFNFLETKINDDQLMRLRTGDGCTVLHAAVNGEYYNLAMSILESYPNLADKRQEKGMTALNLLASKPFSFRSTWLANMSSMSFVPWQTVKILAYHCKKTTSVKKTTLRGCADAEASDDVKVVGALRDLRWRRQKHVVARKLAKKLIEKEKNWIDYPNCENIARQKNRMIDPLIQATKRCIIEIVEEILENFPHAANTVDYEHGHNILHIAAEQKRENIAEQKNLVLYDYLQKTVNHADRMMLDIDYHGNTVLHIAASQDYQVVSVFGPVYSMTWEVFWFKREEDDCHPFFLYHRNYDGKTAQEVFEKNHNEMRKEAEKAAKDMNSGLMLVSTIIGSVNYAALFTLPGGLDQISGLPIFTNRTATERSDLQLFVYYIGGSLFAALLALGTQLSIQLS